MGKCVACPNEGSLKIDAASAADVQLAQRAHTTFDVIKPILMDPLASQATQHKAFEAAESVMQGLAQLALRWGGVQDGDGYWVNTTLPKEQQWSL